MLCPEYCVLPMCFFITALKQLDRQRVQAIRLCTVHQGAQRGPSDQRGLVKPCNGVVLAITSPSRGPSDQRGLVKPCNALPLQLAGAACGQAPYQPGM